MCFIFGRPIFFVSAGVQDNFGEALVGSVITNTWIYVSIDDLEAHNRPLLRTFLMQLEIAKRFREDYLDLFGQEIALGGHTNVLISRTNLLKACEGQVSVSAMFRQSHYYKSRVEPILWHRI